MDMHNVMYGHATVAVYQVMYVKRKRIPARFRPSFTLRSNPATAGSSTRLTRAWRKRTGILLDERVE